MTQLHISEGGSETASLWLSHARKSIWASLSKEYVMETGSFLDPRERIAVLEEVLQDPEHSDETRRRIEKELREAKGCPVMNQDGDVVPAEDA